MNSFESKISKDRLTTYAKKSIKRSGKGSSTEMKRETVLDGEIGGLGAQIVVEESTNLQVLHWPIPLGK